MKTLASFFAIFMPLFFYGQLQIHSIKAERQAAGDNGYTLDGVWMQGARLKLLNTANFGSTGIYPKSVTITDGYELSNSLTDIASVPTSAIFFFGSFDINNVTETFTDAEIDALYQWSLRGGKMIIMSGLYDDNGAYDTRVLNNKWGFMCAQGNTPALATSNSSNLFYGPFGSTQSVNQSATMQSYFVSVPSVHQILTTSSSVPEEANPTLYIDCKTLDLMVADRAVYTSQNGMTNNKNIQTIPDRFWANTIAFMDKMQSPPELLESNDSLSVGSNYLSYQWYKDGEPIEGASTHTYNVTDYGNYYVETKLYGGCILKSPEYAKIDTTAISKNECDLFVPTAFSPDGNGVNDKLCMYGKCFKEMEFKVFNRWGELVFEGDDRYSCWDGTFKGEKSNSGMYVWSFKGTRPSGTVLKRRGSTMLFRR